MFIILWIRTLVGTFLIFPLVTALSSLATIIIILLRGPKTWVDRVVWGWSWLTCQMYGVRLQVNGLTAANLSNQGFLLVFNHSSFMDIFVISLIWPDVRFGAKSSLFKIPLFGPAMRMAGVFPIHRDQRERAIQTLKKQESQLSQPGRRMALSPEGGRLGRDHYLAPFKTGPFYFAINSGVPILPVIIKGASQVWPNKSMFPGLKSWSSVISLEVLPLVETSAWGPEQRGELKDLVYQQMKPFI